MKFKTLITLSLALLMLFTLATPALAVGLGGGGKLNAEGEESGNGAYVLKVTDINELKVTIILIGAEPSYIYNVLVFYTETNNSYIGDIETDEKGNGRFTWISPPEFWGINTHTFVIKLAVGPDIHYTSDPSTVTFR